MLLNLDNFKTVNETCGHDKGDFVLTKTGSTLVDPFRPTDLITRFGGDEYLVLTHRMTDMGVLKHRFDDFRALNRTLSRKLGYNAYLQRR